MKKRSLHTEPLLTLQYAHRACADEDKPDLRYGRACENVFHVDGEKRADGTDQHRAERDDKNHLAEPDIAEEHSSGENQNAVHAGLRQNARKQCRSGRRGNRVRLRKPDVKRESTRLRTEPEQKAEAGDANLLLPNAVSAYVRKFPDVKRAECRIKKEQPH